MKENAVDIAFSQLIKFIKGLVWTYFLLFYRPRPIVRMPLIQPKTLTFLACFILVVTLQHSHGEWLTDLITVPMAFFKAIRSSMEVSIIESFVATIPYYIVAYLISIIITRILIPQSCRKKFSNIFFLYTYWTIVTIVLVLSSVAALSAISDLYSKSFWFEFVTEVILNDWFCYTLLIGVPMVNILRLGELKNVRFKHLRLIIFAISTVISVSAYFKIEEFIFAVYSANDKKFQDYTTIYFPAGNDTLYVTDHDEKHVNLRCRFIVDNRTEKDYFSMNDKPFELSWKSGSEDSSNSFTLAIVGKDRNSIIEIKKGSMYLLEAETIVSVAQFSSLDSLVKIHGHSIFRFGMKVFDREYSFTSKSYDTSNKTLYGDSFNEPIALFFSDKKLENHKTRKKDH